MTALARVGARVLLIDPAARVLLIHEFVGDGRTHWLTPGGGVEPGELPVRAAIREVFEETGIAVRLADDTEPVLQTRREWSWQGVTYDQVDHFFVMAVPAGVAVVPQSLTPMERQTRIGHRWWSVAELRRSTEDIVPPDLADVLDRLARRDA